MAKVNSILQIEGTIGGITFYQRKGVWIARKAGGGFNGKAIKTKASMARVRENGSEFGRCTKSVKLFKNALLPLLQLIKDTERHAALVRLFTQIKDADTVSIRGERNVAMGLQSEAGKALLRHYIFGRRKDLIGLLHCDFRFDFENGLLLENINTIPFPQGATQLEVRLLYTSIAFTEMLFETSTVSVVTVSPTFSGNLQISAPTLPSLEGITIAVVCLRFLQEVNGDVLPLQEQQHNVLQVVGVS